MRRMPVILIVWVALGQGSLTQGRFSPHSAAAADAGAIAAPGPSPSETPVVFDGLGLDDFGGAGSIAAALRGLEAEAESAEPPLGVPVDVLVRGPSGRSTGIDPLAAELRSRIEGIDLSAGMQADSASIQEGPARWVGAVGVSSDHELGRQVLELKTSLGRAHQAGILGVELGPRIERRLRGGTVFFLDGKAQAQARRSADTGSWLMPGLAEQGQGGVGTLGVAASTGLVR
ncbi:MAG: hypothetical protein ACKOHK_15890 [Planctomycetia bacterium]